MKTPKRDYFANAATAYDMFTKPGTSNKFDARWKRKNRVKQLKRTIHKYKTGKGLFRAYSYLMSAYAIMLKTRELSIDASIAECRGHLIYINSIMENLHYERERVLRRIDVLVDKVFYNKLMRELNIKPQ